MQIKDESANVTIEFVGVVIALFIPISYLAIAVTTLAQSYLAVESAARAGARVYVTSKNDAQANYRSQQAVNNLLPGAVISNFEIRCSSNPCLSADGIVQISVSRAVDLPLPEYFGIGPIEITGSQVEVVQAYR